MTESISPSIGGGQQQTTCDNGTNITIMDDELLNADAYDESSIGNTTVQSNDYNNTTGSKKKYDDINNTNNKDGMKDGIVLSSAQTNKEVRQVKVIIILVLLISIAGAIAVFFYTKYSEQEEFENQFNDDANKVRRVHGSFFLCSL